MKLSLLAVLAVLFCGNVLALNCGDTVSGTVNLTANLNCTDQSALVVGAANTTINLNGFSINCTGSGFLGSCQGTAGSSPVGTPIGISNPSFDAFTVKGPGSINGFAYGINSGGGTGHLIQGVTMDGPSVSPALNQRGVAIGIYITDTVCPNPSPTEVGTAATLANNTISHHVNAILLTRAYCVQVFGNNLFLNNGAKGSAHGIAIAGGGHHSLYRNIVTSNGLNRAFDGGIYLTYFFSDTIHPTDHNFVYGNMVSNNCGDGVATNSHASNTQVIANTARFNGVGTNDARCDLAPVGKFHDLTDFGGAGNLWNMNNVCRTQTLTIPAGVCNPAE